MLKRPLIRKFTWTDGGGTVSGMHGWQMRGFEDLDPVMSYGVAHDALEHFDATLGMDAEMMAFGAILYGRVDSGWFMRNSNRPEPAEVLADDIETFLQDGAEWCTRIKQAPLSVEEVGGGWAESELDRLKAHIVDYLAVPDPQRLRLDLGMPVEEAAGRADDMLQWIRKGFRRTARRWDRIGGQQAFMDTFNAIERHPAVQHEQEVGDTLTIRIYGGERLVDIRTRYGDF